MKANKTIFVIAIITVILFFIYNTNPVQEMILHKRIANMIESGNELTENDWKNIRNFHMTSFTVTGNVDGNDVTYEIDPATKGIIIDSIDK